MANQDHVEILKRGAASWNAWRTGHRQDWPDFSEADLSMENVDLRGADLIGADFSDARLNGHDFSGANVQQANFAGADVRGGRFSGDLSGTSFFRAKLGNVVFSRLSHPEGNFNGANLDWATFGAAELAHADFNNASLYGVNFVGANLFKAQMFHTNLVGANFAWAYLQGADLTSANLHLTNFADADLRNANLAQARFVETKLARADLSGSRIYGIAAWNLRLDATRQTDLIVTRDDEPLITVDDLEVAQFVYLLMRSEKLRMVLDTMTSKVVLILGRFTPERKAILNAIRDRLRSANLLPVLFDFEKPESRDLTETVSTLAHLARFVIADLTEAKSIPQELERIVPGMPSLPVVPLLQASAGEYGMFEHFKKYPWVLPIHLYSDLADLLGSLSDKVIAPAEAKLKELR